MGNDGKGAGLKNLGAGFLNFFEEIVFWEGFCSKISGEFGSNFFSFFNLLSPFFFLSLANMLMIFVLT